eukprot:scaffold139643_cov20-Cyclotella_meneghiniana.AAC.1
MRTYRALACICPYVGSIPARTLPLAGAIRVLPVSRGPAAHPSSQRYQCCRSIWVLLLTAWVSSGG